MPKKPGSPIPDLPGLTEAPPEAYGRGYVIGGVRAPKPKPDDAAQSKRFIDAAKEAGVDETGEAFEKAFKKIVPEKRRSPS